MIDKIINIATGNISEKTVQGIFCLIDISYWVCLLAAVISILFLGIGIKKAGKIAPASLIIYILLDGLKMVLKR